MTGFVSPRLWPDTTSTRAFDWLAPMLARSGDQFRESLDTDSRTFRPAGLDAVAEWLPEADLPSGRYFALRFAGLRLPGRLAADGQVHVGLAGESTHPLFDLIAGLIDAGGGKLHGPDAIVFARRVHQDLAGGANDALMAPVASCPVCADRPGRASAPILACQACGALHRADADDADWWDVYTDASGRYFNGIGSPAGVSGGHGYEDYEEWARVILGREHFDERVRWIEDVTGQRGGRALDVGCATGEMVAALTRRGWHATGVDLSRYCLARATEVHPECAFIPGTLEDCGRDWDLVTYLDVFEHLADPYAELRELRRRLRPGGWVVLELPNQASAEAEILGSHYLFGEHQYFYGPKAVSILLDRAGFRVTAISTSHDAYFRVDRVAGQELATELIADDRGERLLVAGQVIL